LIYRILRFGTEYLDRGQDYYERRYQLHLLSHLKRRAKQFGYTLIKTDGSSAAEARL